MENIILTVTLFIFIQEIPDFSGLSSIEFLVLDDNLFTVIPDHAFGFMPSLLELNLRKESLMTDISSKAFTGKVKFS